MKLNYYQNIIIRIALCFIPPTIFYWIFLPITIIGTWFILQPYSPTLVGNELIVNNNGYIFVEACIASTAYWLFWVLAMFTKGISWKKRAKVIVSCFLLFTFVNVLRVVGLVLISLHYGSYWFDVVHVASWKFVSGVMVAGIWIFVVWLYKVDAIPLWDDLKFLWKKSHLSKKR